MYWKTTLLALSLFTLGSSPSGLMKLTQVKFTSQVKSSPQVVKYPEIQGKISMFTWALQRLAILLKIAANRMMSLFRLR